MAGLDLILGQVLTFTEAPFGADPAAAVRHERRGAVALSDGRILATGDADSLVARYPGATRHDHGDALVLPGFVDAHSHFAVALQMSGGLDLWDKSLPPVTDIASLQGDMTTVPESRFR